jgi:hypothetical protein
MSGKSDKDHPKTGRMKWLDDGSTPLIQSYTERLSTFLDALADGKVDKKELEDQEERLVAIMKKVEPMLSDSLHDDVTKLLCELTAYNIMQSIYELSEFRAQTKFRG